MKFAVVIIVVVGGFGGKNGGSGSGSGSEGQSSGGQSSGNDGYPDPGNMPDMCYKTQSLEDAEVIS